RETYLPSDQMATHPPPLNVVVIPAFSSASQTSPASSSADISSSFFTRAFPCGAVASGELKAHRAVVRDTAKAPFRRALGAHPSSHSEGSICIPGYSPPRGWPSRPPAPVLREPFVSGLAARQRNGQPRARSQPPAPP